MGLQSATASVARVDESLERLGLDRIDIAYLHDPDDHGAQAHAEAIPALIELRDEGVVRARRRRHESVRDAGRVRARHDIDVVMLAGRYTLLEQGALDDLLPAAAHRGVGVVAAAVYNSGLLARPRPAPTPVTTTRRLPPALVARANAIADVCEQFGITLPEAADRVPAAASGRRVCRSRSPHGRAGRQLG